MNKLHAYLEHLPLQLGGLSLGIASLGILLESVLATGGYLQLFTAGLAALLFILLCCRMLLAPKTCWRELQHPGLGSIAPTCTMTLMTLCPSLEIFSPPLAQFLWLTAIVLHLLLLGVFAYYRLGNFRLQQMLPSWFIPPIGFVVAVITSPANDQWLLLNQCLLGFGIFNFALLLPLMLNRLIFCDTLDNRSKPTIGVLAAPASLCLTAYLVLAEQPAPLVVAVLLGTALLMTAVVYLALFHLLRLPFSPGLVALTFPLVISARALFQTETWLLQLDISPTQLQWLHHLANLEAAIAAVLVLWVSLAFIRQYWPTRAVMVRARPLAD